MDTSHSVVDWFCTLSKNLLHLWRSGDIGSLSKVSVVISQQICIADYIYINADDLAALYLDYSATQMHEIFNKSLQKGIFYVAWP